MIYTYPQNSTFKGHRSISISVINDPEALKSIDGLKIPNKKYVFDPATVEVPEGYAASSFGVDKYLFPFKGRRITLKEGLRDGEICLGVYVNEHYVGSIPVNGDRQTELYRALQDKTLASVYVRIETQFHNKAKEENKKRTVETEERFRVSLFYKLS